MLCGTVLGVVLGVSGAVWRYGVVQRGTAVQRCLEG